jgi:hypothetical protein
MGTLWITETPLSISKTHAAARGQKILSAPRGNPFPPIAKRRELV